MPVYGEPSGNAGATGSMGDDAASVLSDADASTEGDDVTSLDAQKEPADAPVDASEETASVASAEPSCLRDELPMNGANVVTSSIGADVSAQQESALDASVDAAVTGQMDATTYAIDAVNSSEVGSTVMVTQNGQTFSCSYVLHDAQLDTGDLMAIAANQGALLPGLIYRESALIHGQLEELPIARSGGQFYISLPISQPDTMVSKVTSAEAQRAVAALVSRAANEIDVAHSFSLPALLSESTQVIWSFDQSMISSGFPLTFASPFLKAGFGQSSSALSSLRTFGVLVKLIQPMYTIRFSDDEFGRNVDLFQTGVEWDGPAGQCATNLLDDRAVLIDSVTYGRLIVFQLLSDQSDFSSSSDFHTSVDTHLQGVSLGGSVSGQNGYQTLMQRSHLTQLALGGPQEAAIEAIKTGDFTKYFVTAQVQEAVPLVFTSKRLVRGRPQEMVHDTTRYAERQCCRTDSTVPADEGGCERVTRSKTACNGQLQHGWTWGGFSENDAVGCACDIDWSHASVTVGGDHCAFNSWVASDPSSCMTYVHMGAGAFESASCSWSVEESHVVEPSDVMCCK